MHGRVLGQVGRGAPADAALRLGRYFDTTPESWLNLRANHDLSKARLEMGAEISRAVRQRQHEAA